MIRIASTAEVAERKTLAGQSVESESLEHRSLLVECLIGHRRRRAQLKLGPTWNPSVFGQRTNVEDLG